MFDYLGLKFSFKHIREDVPYTICEVWDQNVLHTRAFAYCNPIDQFNKEFGRKLSLTRALENLKLNKASRTLAWKAYFERRRQSKSGNK